MDLIGLVRVSDEKSQMGRLLEMKTEPDAELLGLQVVLSCNLSPQKTDSFAL
jgi:hypothetical protein